MLRSDVTIIELYMRTANGKPALANLSRGYVLFDSADLVSNKSDGDFIGTCMGFRVIREADLNNGKFQYKNHAGSTLISN